MELEKSHIKKILIATLTSLCSNTIKHKIQLNIEGLFGITIDNDHVILININENVTKLNIESQTNTIKENKTDHSTFNKASIINVDLPHENHNASSYQKLPSQMEPNQKIHKDRVGFSSDDHINNKKDETKSESILEPTEPYSEVLKTVKLVQKADGVVEQLSQVAWKTVDAGGQVVQHKTYETVKTINSGEDIEENQFDENHVMNDNVYEEQANEYQEDVAFEEDYAYEENAAYEENYFEDAADYTEEEQYNAYDEYEDGTHEEYGQSSQSFKMPRQRKKPSKPVVPQQKHSAPTKKGKKPEFEYGEEKQWGHSTNKRQRDMPSAPAKKFKVEVVYPPENSQPILNKSNASCQSNDSFKGPRSNVTCQRLPRANNPTNPHSSQYSQRNNVPLQSSPRNFSNVKTAPNSTPNLTSPSLNAQRISTMLEMAVQLIINKKLTVAKACKLYSLPRNVLLSRLKEKQI